MAKLHLKKIQGSSSTRYPLQEVCQQDNIRLEITDDYPNIHVTRLTGNKKQQFLYKILHLGFYPQQVK